MKRDDLEIFNDWESKHSPKETDTKELFLSLRRGLQQTKEKVFVSDPRKDEDLSWVDELEDDVP